MRLKSNFRGALEDHGSADLPPGQQVAVLGIPYQEHRKALRPRGVAEHPQDVLREEVAVPLFRPKMAHFLSFSLIFHGFLMESGSKPGEIHRKMVDEALSILKPSQAQVSEDLTDELAIALGRLIAQLLPPRNRLQKASKWQETP